uniref:Uncharacterized protein n=1 Tax=Lutzomyia longipalpis TaxID=7200 RepID=A0A1B0CWF4_LUTLO
MVLMNIATKAEMKTLKISQVEIATATAQRTHTPASYSRKKTT